MQFEITDDFIGIFQGYFSNEMCDRYISYFKQMENLQLTNDRTSKTFRHLVDDRGFDLITSTFFSGMNVNYVIANEFTEIFWGVIYEEYSKKYSILKECAKHQIYDIKLQRTSPGQGYHMWHSEATTRMHSNRVLVFSLFLNDVEEGGETEFLYCKKRFQPVKNTLLLWPAGFTHTHRGNQPISGDKYIITGWVEF
jgi:hypothetical protein